MMLLSNFTWRNLLTKSTRTSLRTICLNLDLCIMLPSPPFPSSGMVTRGPLSNSFVVSDKKTYYLFILRMEKLSIFICEAVSNGNWHQFKLQGKKTLILSLRRRILGWPLGNITFLRGKKVGPCNLGSLLRSLILATCRLLGYLKRTIMILFLALKTKHLCCAC